MPTCFWKENNFQLFFEQKFTDQNEGFFVGKCVYTRRMNAVKIFPNAPNGLGWMRELIKEHVLGALGWLK